MGRSKKNWAWAAAVAGFGLLNSVQGVWAESIEFDFKDPKSVNAIVFILDSVLEPIVGVASGISGTVKFDPKDPKSINGTISVQTKNLHIENKGMKDTLHGADWLDAGKFPSIDFKMKEVKEVKAIKDNSWELQVAGELTIHGITKPLAVTVKANFLKDKLESRTSRLKGDLLVLRSDFTIKRKDFGIKTDMGPEVVAEEIQLKVSIVGSAARK